MDIFNSNQKLEEFIVYCIDWATFLRHDANSPMIPFMVLKNEKEQHIRMLITDGDPMEYAKNMLEKENTSFQQFVIGYEGVLEDPNKNKVDSIIVQGFDITQEKGVALGQMFSPKERGGFKKINKVTFLGNPDLILPIKHIENPDYSSIKIGFNSTVIKNKETNLIKALVIFAHENPSLIANSIKQFLRSKFTSNNPNELIDEFDIEIQDNCVNNTELLTFLVSNSIKEVLLEKATNIWSTKYNKKPSILCKYNGNIIFNSLKLNEVQKTDNIETEIHLLSKLSNSELDVEFNKLLEIPNARTNVKALTRMNDILGEYQKRNLKPPGNRPKQTEKKESKKRWKFWK